MLLIAILLLALSVGANAFLGYALVRTDKKRKDVSSEYLSLKDEHEEYIKSTARSMSNLREQVAKLEDLEANYQVVLEQLQAQVDVNDRVTKDLEIAKKKLSRKGCNKKVKANEKV